MYDRQISSRALNEAAGMNRAFLSLAVAGRDAAIRFGISGDIARRINLLEDEALLRLAAMPFSLFCIRLHDKEAWESVLDRRVRDAAIAPRWPAEGSSVQQFLIMTLGGIRDIACRDPHWATLLFGVNPALARVVPEIEIARLPALADAARPLLRARMAGHEDWWGALITAACQGAPHRGAREFGIHRTVQQALNLRHARMPRGRLCRKQ